MSHRYSVILRPNGSVQSEFFYKDGLSHREGDRPSEIHYRTNGSVQCEFFYKEGQIHREGNRPADIHYEIDGSVQCEFFYKEGLLYAPNKICAGQTVEIVGAKLK